MSRASQLRRPSQVHGQAQGRATCTLACTCTFTFDRFTVKLRGEAVSGRYLTKVIKVIKVIKEAFVALSLALEEAKQVVNVNVNVNVSVNGAGGSEAGLARARCGTDHVTPIHMITRPLCI